MAIPCSQCIRQQRSLNRPSAMKPSTDRCWRRLTTGIGTPFRKGLRFAKDMQDSIIPFISGLLYARCPVAIRWCIAQIVVPPLKHERIRVSVAQRPIGKWSVSCPIKTYRDTASTIVRVAREIGIIAARLHVAENAIIETAGTE